jgi:hypothetical protein
MPISSMVGHELGNEIKKGGANADEGHQDCGE